MVSVEDSVQVFTMTGLPYTAMIEANRFPNCSNASTT